MNRISKLKLSLLLTLTSAAVTAADSIPVKPGLWQTTYTHTNPFTGTQTFTEKECITQKSVSLKDFLQEDVEDCQIAKGSVEGNALTIEMSCSVEGVQTIMKGTMSSTGDQGEGKVNMTMQAPGMNMQMEMNWTSKRLGDCSSS